jgi:hypothetical protein
MHDGAHMLSRLYVAAYCGIRYGSENIVSGRFGCITERDSEANVDDGGFHVSRT